MWRRRERAEESDDDVDPIRRRCEMGSRWLELFFFLVDIFIPYIHFLQRFRLFGSFFSSQKLFDMNSLFAFYLTNFAENFCTIAVITHMYLTNKFTDSILDKSNAIDSIFFCYYFCTSTPRLSSSLGRDFLREITHRTTSTRPRERERATRSCAEWKIFFFNTRFLFLRNLTGQKFQLLVINLIHLSRGCSRLRFVWQNCNLFTFVHSKERCHTEKKKFKLARQTRNSLDRVFVHNWIEKCWTTLAQKKLRWQSKKKKLWERQEKISQECECIYDLKNAPMLNPARCLDGVWRKKLIEYVRRWTWTQQNEEMKEEKNWENPTFHKNQERRAGPGPTDGDLNSTFFYSSSCARENSDRRANGEWARGRDEEKSQRKM